MIRPRLPFVRRSAFDRAQRIADGMTTTASLWAAQLAAEREAHKATQLALTEAVGRHAFCLHQTTPDRAQGSSAADVQPAAEVEDGTPPSAAGTYVASRDAHGRYAKAQGSHVVTVPDGFAGGLLGTFVPDWAPHTDTPIYHDLRDEADDGA